MFKCTALVLALAACALAASPRAIQPRIGFNHGRIVGGEDAKRGQFPYQVSLQLVLVIVSSHSCGGSIISSSYILTAGHCVTEVPSIGHYQAVAGEHNLNANDGTEQTIRVAESIVHPDYAGGVAPNDVAVMRLEKPLTYTAAVQPIALPAAGSIPTGLAILSGWGSTGGSILFPHMPDILQTAALPLIPYDECATAVGADNSPLAETNICTGPLTGGFSACSGDSGGPLAQNDEVIGIVSWGFIPCGSVNAPSVYTRVSAFTDFIRKTAGL